MTPAIGWRCSAAAIRSTSAIGRRSSCVRGSRRSRSSRKLGLPLDCVRATASSSRPTPQRTANTGLHRDDDPDALRREHTTRRGVWGRIRRGRPAAHVVDALATDVTLDPAAGNRRPEVPHRVEPLGPVRFFVDFLRSLRAPSRSRAVRHARPRATRRQADPDDAARALLQQVTPCASQPSAPTAGPTSCRCSTSASARGMGAQHDRTGPLPRERRPRRPRLFRGRRGRRRVPLRTLRVRHVRRVPQCRRIRGHPHRRSIVRIILGRLTQRPKSDPELSHRTPGLRGRVNEAGQEQYRYDDAPHDVGHWINAPPEKAPVCDRHLIQQPPRSMRRSFVIPATVALVFRRARRRSAAGRLESRTCFFALRTIELELRRRPWR